MVCNEKYDEYDNALSGNGNGNPGSFRTEAVQADKCIVPIVDRSSTRFGLTVFDVAWIGESWKEMALVFQRVFSAVHRDTTIPLSATDLLSFVDSLCVSLRQAALVQWEKLHQLHQKQRRRGWLSGAASCG